MRLRADPYFRIMLVCTAMVFLWGIHSFAVEILGIPLARNSRRTSPPVSGSI